MSQTTEPAKNYTLRELETKTLKDLYEIAKEVNVPQYREARKRELMFRILKSQAESKDLYFLEVSLKSSRRTRSLKTMADSVSSDQSTIPSRLKTFISRPHKSAASISETATS